MSDLFKRFLILIGLGRLVLPKKPKKPRPYPCCNVPLNMKVQHPRKDITIETCKICHRRHFRLKLENVQSKIIMT